MIILCSVAALTPAQKTPSPVGTYSTPAKKDPSPSIGALTLTLKANGTVEWKSDSVVGKGTYKFKGLEGTLFATFRNGVKVTAKNTHSKETRAKIKLAPDGSYVLVETGDSSNPWVKLFKKKGK